MIPKTGQPRGFTLLELLVAMSMMVVVAACLYSSLYTGFISRRSALIAIEPDIAALNAIELIKQDLIGTMSCKGKFGGSFVGTDSRFGGDDTDSLVFYTTSVYSLNPDLGTGFDPNTSKVAIGGVAKIELILEDSNDVQGTYLLVRQVTTNLLSPDPNSVVPNEQILCRNVKSLNFRFYDGNDWLDQWDSTADANSLPLAVEVDIKIAYDDSRASGAASVLSHNNRSRVISSAKAYKVRELRQAFAIPCGGEALTAATSTSSTSSTGSTSSTSSTSSTTRSGSG